MYPENVRLAFRGAVSYFEAFAALEFLQVDVAHLIVTGAKCLL